MSSHECASPSGPSTSDVIPTVFVVDDDVSVRESLEVMIRGAGWKPKTFASGREFLARPRVPAPSCLVLDVALADLSGLDLQKRVADRTELPIIFITSCGDIALTVQAMKAGAVEFLTKPFRDEELLNAIRYAIALSHTELGREAVRRALRERYTSLSPREREVMALVVSGLLNKQVGGELGISEITVKAHRGKMMRKMQAGSLVDLVNMAAKLGLAPVPKRPLPQPANHSLLSLFPNGRAAARDRIEIVRPLAALPPGHAATWPG
jgi:FixJ family two-component response regulator